MSIEFHLTVMGHRYYESTLPDLVRQLTRLNANLERLMDVAQRNPNPDAPPDETPEPPR